MGFLGNASLVYCSLRYRGCCFFYHRPGESGDPGMCGEVSSGLAFGL